MIKLKSGLVYIIILHVCTQNYVITMIICVLQHIVYLTDKKKKQTKNKHSFVSVLALYGMQIMPNTLVTIDVI